MLTPPALSWTSRLLVRWMRVTDAWSRPLCFGITASIFALTLLAEYLTGLVFSVGVFYLGACAFAVWTLGDRAGMAVSASSVVVSALIKHQQLHTLPFSVSIGTELWSMLTKLGSFALIALLVHGLRGMVALERWHGAHDGLTGVLNKAAFADRIGAMMAHARAERRQLLLAYMDLDGFKAVNDQHGHAAGDRVLCLFAAAAVQVIRSQDLFARIGGDEFALLLTLPAEVDGAHVAQLLHRRFSTILGSTGLDVTCSMGVVLLLGDEIAHDDGIAQADALMYEAKRAGKDGLRVARVSGIDDALRTAFPAPDLDLDLGELLAQIDHAERGRGWANRRAA